MVEVAGAASHRSYFEADCPRCQEPGGRYLTEGEGRFHCFACGLDVNTSGFARWVEDEADALTIPGPLVLARAADADLVVEFDRRFKKRDVERSKRKLAGRILRSWDSPDRAAFLTQGCVMKGVDPFEIPDAIQKITPQSLDRRLRAHFQSGNLAVSVVYPK